ncbi:hypothetical protein EYF80_059131 [Liparis tanakae]|uniref:Uncharacterized protein n=1 Tax=Liparis tanakae TaxID=230148 RepID=A0A4Z2EP89_9TELE|nr:hypothetical protein EYF80_059131 [Liparis tanakae]
MFSCGVKSTPKTRETGSNALVSTAETPHTLTLTSVRSLLLRAEMKQSHSTGARRDAALSAAV